MTFRFVGLDAGPMTSEPFYTVNLKISINGIDQEGIQPRVILLPLLLKDEKTTLIPFCLSMRFTLIPSGIPTFAPTAYQSLFQ